LVFLALSAPPARAQAELGVPLVGRMIDSAGALHEVRGIAGAFVLGGVVGDTLAAQVLSIACGIDMCLAKTASQVIADGAAAQAPPGSAYFAIVGTQAWVYFPATRQFARWQDGSLTPLDLSVDGEVLGLGFDPPVGLLIAVRRAGGVWITGSQGNALRFLRAADGPVLLLDGQAALYAAADHAVLSRAEGTEISFDLPDIRAIFAMGEHWAGVRTSQATYAVRTESGREQMFELPEPKP
jgi:hypothetical protein